MKIITPYLTFAGTIPFIIANICLIFNIDIVFFDIQEFLKIYILVIISFMAGVHWGQHLHLNDQKYGYYLPIFSNIIAISAWLSALIFGMAILLIIFVILFLLLLAIDYRLHQQQYIAKAYFTVRCWVSMIVIANILISIGYVSCR